MSSSPSLQPLYSFDGWVIKNIKLSSDVAVIKIRHDKRHLHQCPFCGQKMGENRRLWQVAKDLPLGTAIWSRLSMRPFRDIASTVSTTQP